MKKKTIHFRGNATGYFYYIGYGLLLNNHYNLKEIQFSGCSSGAIIATLLALELDLKEAATAIVQVQPKKTHPFALLGNWKKRLKEYLEYILLVERDYETVANLRIGVEFIHQFRFIQSFTSKQDVIACLLASTHIPFFMDFKPLGTFRGKYCIDGDFFRGYERMKESNVLYINSEIPVLKSLSPLSENQITQLIIKGYRDAAADKQLFEYLGDDQRTPYSEEPLEDYLEAVKGFLVADHYEI